MPSSSVLDPRSEISPAAADSVPPSIWMPSLPDVAVATVFVVDGSAPPPSVMFPPAEVTVPWTRIPPPADVAVSESELRMTLPLALVTLPVAVTMMFSVELNRASALRDSTAALTVRLPSVDVSRMFPPAVPPYPLEMVPSKLTFPPPF